MEPHEAFLDGQCKKCTAKSIPFKGFPATMKTETPQDKTSRLISGKVLLIKIAI